jgi:pimeloyl-ACP methyl ester carboxylesterase
MIYSKIRAEISNARKKVLAGSEILRTKNVDIEYAVKGEGPPTLVLHGAGGGYDQGLLLGKFLLGQGYKFVSASRFGYIRSPIPKDSTVQAQANIYTTLLDHLKIDKVIVVGGSAGGPSALQFTHDYPERCSALILGSALSMSRAPGDKNMFFIKVIHLIQRYDSLYWVFARVFQSIILQLLGVSRNVYRSLTLEQKKLAQEILDGMHPMSLRRKGTLHDSEIRPLDSVSMSEISVPTLIFHAKDDGLVNYRHAEFSHRNIKQSELVFFETGGHLLLPQINSVREQARVFLTKI